ncbi:MAG: hypothetical protein SGILL_009163, partial [Bacillariaceae sp.]
ETLCVVVHHEDFKTKDGKPQELWCAESHIKIHKQGPTDKFFDMYGGKRLGVGAKVAFDSKYAHPHKTRDEVLGKDHRTKIENAIVIRQEMKTVDHSPAMCVVVEHGKFKNGDNTYHEIYCAESHVEILQEGDPSKFFEEYGSDEKGLQASERQEAAVADDDAIEDEELVQDLKVEGKLRSGFHLTADYFKWEVLFRSCFQLLFGYIITVTYLPNIIPTNGTFLIGTVISTCAVTVPNAMYSMMAVYPLVIGIIIL